MHGLRTPQLRHVLWRIVFIFPDSVPESVCALSSSRARAVGGGSIFRGYCPPAAQRTVVGRYLHREGCLKDEGHSRPQGRPRVEGCFFSNWQEEEQELEKKKEMKGMHEWRAHEDHAYKIVK